MKILHSKYQDSRLLSAFKVLDISDRRKIALVVLIQIMMGFMDLAAVAIVGVLGALSVSGVQSRAPGNRVNSVLELIGLDGMSLQAQVAILGSLAALLMVSRTLFSVFFMRKILYFLSMRGAVISSSLFSKLLNTNLGEVQKRTTQETIYSLTIGVNTIVLSVIGSSILVISDASLMIIMAVGLFYVDPFIASFTFIGFAFVGFAMYRLLHKRAKSLGENDSLYSVKISERISEVLTSYRESIVRNRREYYSREIGELRTELAKTLSALSFLPNISKYVIEMAVVVGALVISGFQFLVTDAPNAVATLAVFLAAGTRVAPAALRLQQGAIQIKGSLGTAAPTLAMIKELGGVSPIQATGDQFDVAYPGFEPQIQIDNVNFSYPNQAIKAISGVSLSINPGEFVAIVGPSGSGKTTLVDLILGVLEPSTGEIVISGCPPLVSINRWPGAIAYVPQDVAIVSGTIRENIAMGYPIASADEELIEEALRISDLASFAKTLEFGLDTEVGERGTRISGGQRQRLGIARALYTKPKFLVLDEATSALDGETEANISESLLSLRGKVTILMIAHRLTTVKNADKVLYVSDGTIKAQGTFEEVRAKIPNFEKQAQLVGL